MLKDKGIDHKWNNIIRKQDASFVQESTFAGASGKYYLLHGWRWEKNDESIKCPIDMMSKSKKIDLEKDRVLYL